MFSARARVSNLFLTRQVHGNAEIIENCKELRNRNPRNLERLRIGRKEAGYHLERDRPAYWHKLVITTSSRAVTAEIHHFENGPILEASSGEWALKKYLYRLTDSSAYINVGRLLAQRCLESGICEIHCNKESHSGEKAQLLISEIVKAGISIKESGRYKHPHPWNQQRLEKPWETFE